MHCRSEESQANGLIHLVDCWARFFPEKEPLLSLHFADLEFQVSLDMHGCIHRAALASI